MLGHMRKEHSDYPADECAIPQEEENNVINGLDFCNYCCVSIFMFYSV